MNSQVIVVGGGLAGLSAAHTLLERASSEVRALYLRGPLNFELTSMASVVFSAGNSTKATSGINGAGTQPQQDLGIRDSAKIFFEDTKASAKDLARDDLIKVLTGRSGDAVTWLQEKFGLDLSKVARLGGHSQPRTHRGDAQFPGMVITYAQLERLEDLAESSPDRVQIKKKANVTSLLTEGEGDAKKVIGVEYKDSKGEAHKAYGPVILATGGYAADFTESSFIKQYRPELYDLPTTNGDHSTGDGHKMAINIGSRAIDMEKIQVHPTGLVDPKDPEAKVKFLAAEALRGVGGLLLDNQGQRFCDELGRRDYVTGEIWKNGKYPIRLVLNGKASTEIEWHCKHYVGRGLMKRFESGEALAKEIGIKPEVLKKTFDTYNKIAEKKNDPFGKKFFHNLPLKMDDFFHVAIMTPVLHYTMGGLEIDPASRVIGQAGKAIPGLYAGGEVAGGVHGANRLGGSSLLGCVVFGRVCGDTAASYLLQTRATERLGNVAGHLLETKVKINPNTSTVNLEFSWAGQQSGSAPSSSSPSTSSPAASSPSSSSSQAAPAPLPAADASKTDSPASSAGAPAKKGGQYTKEEVAKHNTKDDCWVIVDGQVLDVTSFLSEHPGGEKAILLYAGKDATEEFNMLHDPKVIPRYAPDSVIGTLKQ